jgi:O-methyltransferase domain/Dimerisation domain
MAEVTPDPIMRIAMGFMAAKHLFIASDIGLFTGLAQGPATLDQIAATCGIPRRTAGISADAMVSLGLLERDGERYCNSEVAATFLAGRDGPDLRPMLHFWNHISYPGWLALEDAVRAGAGQAKFGQFSIEEQQIFSAGVQAFSMATAASLAANYDFSRHRRLLDIGGGTGSFLLAVLRRHAALRGTLFELPGACEVARQRLANEPERTRIDVVEGDLVSDPLPPGHDILLVANTVHVLSATHNVDLLRKLRGQAELGTQLLLVDLWMDSGHTQPPAAALMSGEFLIISGEGSGLWRGRRRGVAARYRLAQVRAAAARRPTQRDHRRGDLI